MRRGIFVGSAAVGCVAALVLSGCGSSSSAPRATGGGGSASSSSSLTGAPIKIGVIGSNSGSQASSASQGDTVAPAWADWVNKEKGGIGGHPVQIISLDDKADPATAQAIGKQLIDDGVQVVLAASDNLVPAYDTELIAAKIPVVSGQANSSDWYTKVGLYPTPTDVLSGLMNQVAVAKQFGHATKFANLYCSEVAACAQAGPPLKSAAEKAGIGYVGLAVSSTSPSYTSQCITLQQQKVDYAQLNFPAAAAAKFIADCQAQGYNPTWGSSEAVVGPDFTKLSNVTLFGPAYAFPEAADSPLVAQFTDAMTKYAKNDNWHDGSASFAWSGLEVIRKALANVSASTPVTAATVTDGLNSIKDEDLGGLLANKITFTAGKATAFGAHPCTFVVGIKAGKITAPNGMTPVCPSAA